MIPGPSESGEQFLARVAKEPQGSFPPELRPALARVASLFDLSPSWIPITYSNRGLRPWHGGVMDPAGGIQLRAAFQNNERYLGIYSRQELVAHELVHAGRIAFNEPKFEELFAYQVSNSPLRRWIGPMVERPWEVWAFLASVLVPLMADYTCLAFGWWAGFRLLMPLKVLPGLLVGMGIWRTIGKHRILNRLLRKLERLTDKRGARAIAYRLSDAEIIRFSKQRIVEIREELMGASGIRFEQIRHYFSAAYCQCQAESGT